MRKAVQTAMQPFALTEADLADLARRGISAKRIQGQIAHMRAWQPWIAVDRAAISGDGIRSLDCRDRRQLLDLADEAAGEGRISGFVPASGDATRLFERLSRACAKAYPDFGAISDAAEAGDEDAIEARLILRQLDNMAISRVLEARGVTSGSPAGEILNALAGSGDDAFARYPKGLVPFHLIDGLTRSAVAEHLIDAASLGAQKITFTSQRRHTVKFDAEFSRMRDALDAIGGGMEVEWRLQDPRFDAVALDDKGLLRDDGGDLIFRPGGHGVLIHILSALRGDIVSIRNIDNVVHQRFKQEGHDVRRRMIGLAVDLTRHIHRAYLDIRSGGDIEHACAPLFGWLDWDIGELVGSDDVRRAACLALLDRPLRVCGMVRDLDHKGGGPFWVNRNGRGALQIVEGANLDARDPAQAAKIAAATHFHPVDMIVSLKDPNGRHYDLGRYLDDDLVILTEKSRDGRPIRVFEYPGLWNGAMGNWNSVFVDIPATLFNPVKYLSDLLKPRHQS